MPVLLQDLMRLQEKGEVACCVAFAGSGGVVTVKMSGSFNSLVEELVPHGCSRARSGFGLVRTCCEDQFGPWKGGVGQDEQGLVTVGFWGRVDNPKELGLRRDAPDLKDMRLAHGEARFLAGRMARALGQAGDLEGSLDSVLERVRGRFSLVCLHSRRTDRLWWVCRGLPLFLGRGKGELFVSTELKTILAHGVELDMVDTTRLCWEQVFLPPSRQGPPHPLRVHEPTLKYRAPHHSKLDCTLAHGY